MTSYTVFLLSDLAKDIRETVQTLVKKNTDDTETTIDFRTIHDDYKCLATWADIAGFWITVKKIEIPRDATMTSRLTEFLEKKFERRSELLKRKSQLATEAFQSFKVLLARLLKEDETLQSCKDLAPNDTSSLLGLIDDMDSIRAAINAYYIANATTKEGQLYIRNLGESLLKALSMLEEGQEVPLEMFKGEASKIDESVHKLSLIFKALKPSVRQEISATLNGFMHHALGCFILYRFPVEIIKGQPPIYFSRFIPHVILGNYLQKYQVNFGEFVM